MVAAGMPESLHRSPGRRANPLPASARRAALVAATLPLLRQRGFDVTTRQLAAAARVAEGTIFRVFPDKDSLIRATLIAAFDPAPVVAQIERLDCSTPLPERLTAAVRIVQTWLTSFIGLMAALHASRQPGQKLPFKRPRPLETVGKAIARLIEPEAALLRVSPDEAARLLHLLLFAGSHPIITDGKLLTPEEIVGTVLDGVRTPRRT